MSIGQDARRGELVHASDYYVLIVRGRYGSTDNEGLGYTEKEYDYAVQTKKPVTALRHEKPGTLAREKQVAWCAPANPLLMRTERSDHSRPQRNRSQLSAPSGNWNCPSNTDP